MRPASQTDCILYCTLYKAFHVRCDLLPNKSNGLLLDNSVMWMTEGHFHSVCFHSLVV